ncbi:hypothetical protein BGZ51_000169, partial [Haplosporangium sp. Z 767]
LINQAFVDGDETWRLMWLQNRLYAIESVENLSFHIPGFREHYNYFPDLIYYSATDQEIEEFKATYPADFSTSNVMSTDTSKADMIPTTEIPNQELKDELKQAREQISMLQQEVTGLRGQNTVLLEQNTAIQEQMKEVQVLLSTLLVSKAGVGFS